MPLTISIYKISLKPALKFITIFKNNGSLAFFEALPEWAMIFIELIFELSNTIYIIIRKITAIRGFIFPYHLPFTLHFSIFEFTNINSTIIKIFFTIS